MPTLQQNFSASWAHTKSFPGLSITPLVKAQPSKGNFFRFLWEGFQDQSVAIEELEASSVPQVKIANQTSEPFLAYKGMMIRGGGQNRQLLHSFIIGNKQSLEVPVQCVQQGRWNPDTNKSFYTKEGGDLSNYSLRAKRNTQAKTWETIKETTTLSGTRSVTADYTVMKDFLTGTQEDARKTTRYLQETTHAADEKRQRIRNQAQQIIQELGEPLEEQVGLYICLEDHKGNLSYCLELFSSPDNYRKLHRELISSLVTETIALKDKGRDLQGHARDKYEQFLTKVADNKWQQTKGLGVETRQEMNSGDFFGEAIYEHGDLVHLICSEEVQAV